MGMTQQSKKQAPDSAPCSLAFVALSQTTESDVVRAGDSAAVLPAAAHVSVAVFTQFGPHIDVSPPAVPLGSSTVLRI